MKKKYYEKDKWYYILPIMFISIVIPLIVYLKLFNLSGDVAALYSGKKNDVDFFSYYKAVWFLIGTVLAIIMLFVKCYKNGVKTLKKSCYYVPMAVYLFFVILSTALSKYPEISMYGFPERFEGMYVLIGYMLILFVTMNLVNKEEYIEIIFKCILISAVILGVIGLFQYLGLDLWKSDFGKNMIIPDEYKKYSDKIVFTYDNHNIYATTYHSDYVGNYMSMILPLLFVVITFIKNDKLKVSMSFIMLIFDIIWMGCGSDSGILGGTLAVIIFFIMLNKSIVKYWKFFSIAFIMLVLVFFMDNAISSGNMSSKVFTMFHDTQELLSKRSSVDDKKNKVILRDIKIQGSTAEFITNKEVLKIVIYNGEIYFKDKDNNVIKIQYDKNKGKIYISDSRYKKYDIKLYKSNNNFIVSVVRNPTLPPINFEITSKNISLIDNNNNKIDLRPVESIGFKGKETLGSARGYIWSRSIPLLRNTIFCGYGPDTFAMFFPQWDLIGKMNAYHKDGWILVDKPHNLYLGVALNTGIISLIAFLAIFVIYFIKSIKIYFSREYTDFISVAGLAIFVGICGYLTAAFFNDSVISVAPIFWILLGMGISINYILSEKSKLKLSQPLQNSKRKKHKKIRQKAYMQ